MSGGSRRGEISPLAPVLTDSVASMLTFLSPPWLDALDAAARRHDGSGAVSEAVSLTVEQEVTGPGGAVTFHVSFDQGQIRVNAGPATGTAIRFSSDRATAWALSTGERSAQRSFMAGELRVGGDLRGLLDQQEVLAALSDLFADVRGRTTFEPVPPALSADQAPDQPSDQP